MKLDKRHLRLSLVLLVGSILYNVWVYTRPAKSASPRPVQAQTSAPAALHTAPSVASVDPASITAPPPLDLRTEPTWPRDPFASAQRLAGEQAGAAAPRAAAETEPVVRTILFSPERRLALVGGRIVKVGDRVDSGSVAEIERDAVIIRMPSGERKRLVLRPPTSRGVRK